MAFDAENFVVIAGGVNSNAPSIYGYKTTDAVAAGANGVDASGYFNAAAARLKVGDIILVYKTDATIAAAFFVVLTNTRDLTSDPPVSGVVDTANLSVLVTAVDSD